MIGANVLIGILAGCKPLIVPGSTGATAQVVIVFSVQLSLAILCYTVAPDADRFVSSR